MNPGQLFEDLAATTWQRLIDGGSLRIRQGETAITDHLLLEIARLRHPAIRVFKTPQDKEDVRGTDWEWWIGAPDRGWLRYAVQAKRIDIQTGTYGKLGHKVGDQRQADILLRFATASRAIPIYCFYNYAERGSFDGFWHCHRPITHQQLGCSIAPLHVISEAIEKRGCRTFDWIHSQGTSLLADLPLENGAAPEALKEYEAVLKTAPRRLNSTAGAARAADKAGDKTKARAYAMQLREIANNAETSRPELEWARVYLGTK